MDLDFLKGKKHFKAYLVTIHIGDEKYRRVVDGKSFTIGRSLECTLPIPEPNISRIHLIVTTKSEDAYIADQGSSNGTFINDQRIEQKKNIQIKPTDLIKLGNTEVKLQIEVFEKLFNETIIDQEKLPESERKKIRETLEGANQQAERIILLAQEHNEKLSKISEEKILKREAEILEMERDIKLRAEQEAQEIINNGKREAGGAAEQIISDSKTKAAEEANKIHAEVANEKKVILKQVKQKLDEATQLQVEANESLQVSRQKAENIEKTAQMQAKETIEQAKAIAKAEVKTIYLEAEKYRIDEDFKAKKLIKEATETLQAAYKKAEETIANSESEAKDRAKAIILEAEKIRIDEEFKIKALRTEVENLKLEAETMLKEAGKKGHEIRDRAKKEAATTEIESRIKAKEEAAKILSDAVKKAKESADTMALKAEKEAEEIRCRGREEAAVIEKIAIQKAEEAKADYLNRAKFEADKNLIDISQAISEKKMEFERLLKEQEVASKKENDKLKKDLDLQLQRHAVELEKQVEAKASEIKRLSENSEEAITRQKSELKHLAEKREFEIKRKEEELKHLYEKHVFEIDKVTAQKEKAMIERVENQLKDKKKELHESELAFEHINQEIERKNKKDSEITESLAHTERALEEVTKTHTALTAKTEKLQKQSADLEKVVLESKTKIENLEQRSAQLLYKIEEDTKRAKDLEREAAARLDKKSHELDKEYAHLKVEKEKQFTEAYRLETEKAKKMAEQFLTEIQSKKEVITKDLSHKILDLFSPHLEKDKFKLIERRMDSQINAVFDENLAGISTQNQTVSFNATEINKKLSRQRIRNIGLGLSLGIAITIGSLYTNKKVQERSMASVLEAEKKERDEEMAARRFEPPQDREVRDNYTDSVIYTKDFVKLYNESEVQGRWLKAAKNYFYESWRIPEETTIEVLAKAKTLVQGLEDKRKNIHPDFVDQNIKKMRELEDESVTEIKAKLGTDVKYEAFKKFERKFFMNEIAKREPAEVLVDPNLTDDKN